jgi:CBS domain containing-hemolysin-like protein
MGPLSRFLLAAMHYFHDWEEEVESNEDEASDEEIQAFIDAGQEEGILEHDEGEMIQSIVHFGDKVAREVMTSRTQIAAIDIDASIENLLDLIVRSGHSRIPAIRGNIDNVEGLIHERDLLHAWRRGEKPPGLKDFVKPVQFIPETKPVGDLLREMKQNGDHLVLVVDEYGGVSGVLTMEDLLEEIVGDIHDTESDSQKPIAEGPGVYVVPGTLELGALDTLLGASFVEETECTTVAGAVVELFGRLPMTGERIEHRGVAVEVLESDRRRVQRLRLRVLTPPAPKTNGHGKQSGSAVA